jgi:hypothetical protein
LVTALTGLPDRSDSRIPNMLSYIQVDTTQVHHRAIGATVASLFSALIAHLAPIHDLIQTVAGVVAIGSGCMAIAYYYVSILEKLRNRKEKK